MISIISISTIICLKIVIGNKSQTVETELIDQTELSMVDSIYNTCIEMGIQYPEVVVAQAILETGHFTSVIYLENNNLFGMKKAYIRTRLQTGTNRGHATYDSWRDSLIDYALYQSHIKNKKSQEEYINHLANHYAEDKQYKNKINKILNTLEFQT